MKKYKSKNAKRKVLPNQLYNYYAQGGNYQQYGLKDTAATIGSRTAQGAALGTMIAPGVGTAIGGGVGAIAGGVESYMNGQAAKANNDLLYAQEKDMNLKRLSNANRQAGVNLMDYNHNISQAGNSLLRAAGGYVNQQQGIPVQGGQLQQVNSTDSVAQGRTHEQGGIQIPGAEIEGQENMRTNPYTGQQEVDSARIGTAQANQPLMEMKGQLENTLKELNTTLAAKVKLKGTQGNIHTSNSIEREIEGLQTKMTAIKGQIGQLEQQIETNFAQQQQVNGEGVQGQQGQQGEQKFAQGGIYAELEQPTDAYGRPINAYSKNYMNKYNTAIDANRKADNTTSYINTAGALATMAGSVAKAGTMARGVAELGAKSPVKEEAKDIYGNLQSPEYSMENNYGYGINNNSQYTNTNPYLVKAQGGYIDGYGEGDVSLEHDKMMADTRARKQELESNPYKLVANQYAKEEANRQANIQALDRYPKPTYNDYRYGVPTKSNTRDANGYSAEVQAGNLLDDTLSKGLINNYTAKPASTLVGSVPPPKTNFFAYGGIRTNNGDREPYTGYVEDNSKYLLPTKTPYHIPNAINTKQMPRVQGTRYDTLANYNSEDIQSPYKVGYNPNDISYAPTISNNPRQYPMSYAPTMERDRKPLSVYAKKLARLGNNAGAKASNAYDNTSDYLQSMDKEKLSKNAQYASLFLDNAANAAITNRYAKETIRPAQLTSYIPQDSNISDYYNRSAINKNLADYKALANQGNPEDIAKLQQANGMANDQLAKSTYTTDNLRRQIDNQNIVRGSQIQQTNNKAIDDYLYRRSKKVADIAGKKSANWANAQTDIASIISNENASRVGREQIAMYRDLYPQGTVYTTDGMPDFYSGFSRSGKGLQLAKKEIARLNATNTTLGKAKAKELENMYII